MFLVDAIDPAALDRIGRGGADLRRATSLVATQEGIGGVAGNA